MDRVAVMLEVSARLVLDIQQKRLMHGRLPRGLAEKAARVLQMEEAERVVGILQHVQGLLREAVIQAHKSDLVPLSRLLDGAGRLLRALRP